MTAFMFPGQGSQVKGMGANLFAQFSVEVNQANDILGYPIEDLCLNNPQLLANTAYTQPALYVVEVLSYQAQYATLQPTFCIGHSLGEYAALYVAGAFDFLTGLRLVQKRGALMSAAKAGGMLAVINLDATRITTLLQQHDLNSIDFANYNSSRQIVLSGPAEDISKANNILSKEALMCVPLQVSGAFHSRYMESAAKEFEHFLQEFTMLPLRTQVIANVTAQPYTNESIKDNLIKQITSPVRWSESISYIKNQDETEFIEIGPGNVLTKLMAQQH